MIHADFIYYVIIFVALISQVQMQTTKEYNNSTEIPDDMVTENSTEQSPQLRAGEKEEQLLEAIRDKIPRYSPPEIENKVFVAASIGQIINVDEKQGVWTALLEIRSFYQTKHELWPSTWSVDASQTGIPCLVVPQDYVWAPSLTIENVVDPETNLKSQKQLICKFGLVMSHYSFFTPKMSCDFDVSKFPFDKQSCHITIQQKPERLWNFFFGIQLEETVSNATNGGYIQDEQWDLISAETTVVNQNQTILVQVQMRRQSLHYVLIFVLPTLVLYLLSGLSFLLPSDACEKISFAVTILLAQVVAFSALGDILPASSTEPPVLLFFLTRVLWHMGLLCLVAVFVINLSQNGWRMWMGPRLLALIQSPWLKIIGLTPLSDKESYSHNIMRRPSAMNPWDRLGSTLKGVRFQSEEKMEKAKELNDIRWKFFAIVADRLFLLIHVIFVTCNITLTIWRLFN